MILVDTNVFLEFLTGQKRADECGSLLARLSKGDEEGTVTRFTLHAIEALSDPGSVGAFLSNVERSMGLAVYDTDTAEEGEAAKVAENAGLDFDDALQYYVAKKVGARAIVSFDRHFDGLDVPRKSPAEVADARSRA